MKKSVRVKQNMRQRVLEHKSTSIYFLVWSAFSLVAFLTALLCSIFQPYVIRDTYESQLSADIAKKGNAIHFSIDRLGSNAVTSEQYSALIRHLAIANSVEVYILYEDGKVLFPYPEISDGPPARSDFSSEVQELILQIEQNEGHAIVYSNERECVYGAPFGNFHGKKIYLYVAESTEFLSVIMRETRIRIWFIAVFVFLISFAISSALAGFLVAPLAVMREKTNRFARGDFGVDFLDGAYGGEIVELAQTLNFARDEISKADKMQKELIANVSHDFKTPLTMIKSYASMIREISGDIPEKRNKHALVIEEEADRLTALVNDVLELSKLASGIGELKLVDINLSSCVYEILNRFEYLSETQGYQFIVDVDDGIYTRADELKISQVLYNLIGNAVNYTGEDKRVFISLKRDGVGAKFSVRDTGKGIKEEDIPSIWERYYRSSEAHKRPVKGTGLGLSIVKSALEKHGFIYGVRSQVGKGSEFYVIFPNA